MTSVSTRCFTLL